MGKPRVLLVEDDEPSARLLRRALELRYDVTLAADGEEGLERAQRDPPPDVIVTDIQMPRMDGVTMASELKHLDATRHIPIVFLTSHDRLEDLVAAIGAGARRWLTKPVAVDALERAVEQSLVPRRRPGRA